MDYIHLNEGNVKTVYFNFVYESTILEIYRRIISSRSQQLDNTSSLTYMYLEKIKFIENVTVIIIVARLNRSKNIVQMLIAFFYHLHLAWRALIIASNFLKTN